MALEEKEEREKEVKKKKAYELRKKLFLQKVMSGEIDISQLRKKKKKKLKKKKSYRNSNYVKTGKLLTKNQKKKIAEDTGSLANSEAQ